MDHIKLRGENEIEKRVESVLTLKAKRYINNYGQTSSFEATSLVIPKGQKS